MKIVGKCIISKTQLENSERDGLLDVELQLFNELETMNDRELLDILKEVPVLRYPSLHSPLIGNSRATLIEHITDPKYSDNVKRTCSLAQLIAEYQGKPVITVFHSTIPGDSLIETPRQHETLLEEIKELLEKYPNISISLENTCNVSKVKTGKLSQRPVFSRDVEELVKFIRAKLNTDRVTYTLDTGHLYSEIYYLNLIAEDTGVRPKSMRYYVTNAKNILGNIHFSNSVGLGLLPGTHGTPFSMEDKEKLDELLAAYYQIGGKVNCVLELTEEDYEVNSNKNKLSTIETIKELGYTVWF